MRAALLLTLLAGCAVPPEAPPSRAALIEGPWPRIVPVPDLSAASGRRLDAAEEAALLDRAARLRGRAAALAGPVIGADERARLSRPALR